MTALHINISSCDVVEKSTMLQLYNEKAIISFYSKVTRFVMLVTDVDRRRVKLEDTCRPPTRDVQPVCAASDILSVDVVTRIGCVYANPLCLSKLS